MFFTYMYIYVGSHYLLSPTFPYHLSFLIESVVLFNSVLAIPCICTLMKVQGLKHPSCVVI